MAVPPARCSHFRLFGARGDAMLDFRAMIKNGRLTFVLFPRPKRQTPKSSAHHQPQR
jgi:hypothetical protein